MKFFFFFFRYSSICVSFARCTRAVLQNFAIVRKTDRATFTHNQSMIKYRPFISATYKLAIFLTSSASSIATFCRLRARSHRRNIAQHYAKCSPCFASAQKSSSAAIQLARNDSAAAASSPALLSYDLATIATFFYSWPAGHSHSPMYIVVKLRIRHSFKTKKSH